MRKALWVLAICVVAAAGCKNAEQTALEQQVTLGKAVEAKCKKNMESGKLPAEGCRWGKFRATVMHVNRTNKVDQPFEFQIYFTANLITPEEHVIEVMGECVVPSDSHGKAVMEFLKYVRSHDPTVWKDGEILSDKEAFAVVEKYWPRPKSDLRLIIGGW